MDRVELVRGFIRGNLKLLTTSPFNESEYRRRKKQYFLERHGNSKQGNPRDSEIASETVWFLIKKGQVTTKQKLAEILANGLPAEKCPNREVFENAVEAEVNSAPATVVDFSKVGRAEFLDSLREQIREQLEKEMKVQGRSIQTEQAIEDADRKINERLARIAALPSVIDAREFNEPSRPPEEADSDEKLLWWEKLHLTDDPFKQKEGLYDIEPERYDSVVVRTPLFRQYIRYMEEIPQELFKNTILFGEYGSGKTALFQYLKRALDARQIDSAIVSLSGYPNFQAFKSAFEEKLADQLAELTGDRDQGLSLKVLVRKVGQKSKFKGLVIFIDNLNKLREDTPAALTFLAYLQVYRNELAPDVLGKLGFYVAGALAWRDPILAEPRYSGSLLRREVVPPITVEQAIEMLNRRLESYYPNPDVKRTVRKEFIEQVYKNLITHNEELTFRKFMERLQIEFENNDFAVLAADPVRIPGDILTDIRSVFNVDLVLKERFRNLLEDKIKINQENGIFCIRLLIDIFQKERTKRLRDEDLDDSKKFYLSMLDKTGLVSRVDEGDHQHSWAVCSELERTNKIIAQRHSLSLDDYLLKIYGIPEVKRKRANEQIDQIRAFSEECEKDSREMMTKILSLHTEISESLEYYTETTSKPLVLSKCVDCLDTLTQFFVTYVERPEEIPAKKVDLMFWKDFWFFPDEISEFQNRLADEEDCIEHIWNTIGSYNQAFKKLFPFVVKEYRALSSVYISSHGLTKDDMDALAKARDLWIGGRNDTCVAALSNHMEKKARRFVQNITTLVYGNSSNRIKHLDRNSRAIVQAAIDAGRVKRGSPFFETDFLSFKELLTLMTSGDGKEKGPGSWHNIFSKIFEPVDAKDLAKYYSALELARNEFQDTAQRPRDPALDLREIILQTVDLTRKMNAGYGLMLDSLYLVSENAGTNLCFSLSGLSDKSELPEMPFQPDNLKILSDGLASGRWDLDDAEYIETSYSKSISYREFVAYLGLALSKEKSRSLGAAIPYVSVGVSGCTVSLKRVFKFNQDNPPRLILAYSGRDEKFAQRVAEDIRANGVNVWADDFDLTDGDPINPANHEPLRENDTLGVLLSRNAINSEWLQKGLTVDLIKELRDKKVAIRTLVCKKCEIPVLLKSSRMFDFSFNYQSTLEGLLASIEESMPVSTAYNKRIDVVGQRIGDLMNSEMSRNVSADWMIELLDKGVVFKARDRLKDKVPEDPRSQTYQFLTLGELKVALRVPKVWSMMRETFVNVRDSSSSLKFNTDELFFGHLDLLIDYRNPPSHGIEVSIAKGNMEMIGASLFKLEGILSISPQKAQP